MCPENFFNIYFHEQMFFKIVVAKGDTVSFFWEVIVYEQYNFYRNLEVVVLIF